MKKNTMVVFGMLLAVAVLFSGVAFADAVAGKVNAVDSAASTIEIAKTDATGASENVKIAFDAATTFTGVAAAAELKAGDDVKIEASKDEATGSWKAASVEVVKA